MAYSTDPAWDHEQHIKAQERYQDEIGRIDPTERLTEALDGADGMTGAKAGEYGVEAQFIGHALALAVERRANGTGASDADILAALDRAADELIRNRPESYWERVSELQRQARRVPAITIQRGAEVRP